MSKEASKDVNCVETAEKQSKTVKGPKPELAKQTESFYTLEELSENAKQLFGVRAECVVAALKATGIRECTVSKAKEIIKAFMKKEVK